MHALTWRVVLPVWLLSTAVAWEDARRRTPREMPLLGAMALYDASLWLLLLVLGGSLGSAIIYLFAKYRADLKQRHEDGSEQDKRDGYRSGGRDQHIEDATHVDRLARSNARVVARKRTISEGAAGAARAMGAMRKQGSSILTMRRLSSRAAVGEPSRSARRGGTATPASAFASASHRISPVPRES